MSREIARKADKPDAKNPISALRFAVDRKLILVAEAPPDGASIGRRIAANASVKRPWAP
jgi:hypothetical protein